MRKNIDELTMVMMREKFNFTGKNDNEEITHVLNLLPSQSKFYGKKYSKYINKKAHSLHLKFYYT